MSGAATQINIREVAEAVACGLSKATVIGERAYIRTPVLLPSGSTVVISVEGEGGGTWRVSDLSQGQEEADLLDLGTIYRGQAKEVSAQSGVLFNGHAFILSRLAEAKLIAAVMAVANATSRTLERTIQRAEQRSRATSVEKLVGRLKKIFPPDSVRSEADIKGASSHSWRVDAFVNTETGTAVFDIVTPHQTSIAFATTKFHDLARLDKPPVRVAVVHNKQALGDMLKVVSQAARVIEDDAADRTYLRAAA